MITKDEGRYFGEDGVLFKRQEGVRVTSAVAKRQSVLLRFKKDFFFNNFKSLIESEKLSEKSVQDTLKQIKLKTQENEEMESYYSSNIIKKQNQMKQKKEILIRMQSQNSVSLRQDTQQSQISEILMEEDDILKTQHLKKNLFEIYREERNPNLGMTRNTLSPISKYPRVNILSPQAIQKRSTLKLDSEVYSQFDYLAEEYLYPNVNQDLNPHLFVIKTKKGMKIQSKGGRSVSQISIKTPTERNQGTPSPSSQQIFFDHSNQGSQIISSSMMTLNKIVKQIPKSSGIRSNQQSPIKINTPVVQSRSQSALNIKKQRQTLDQINLKNFITPYSNSTMNDINNDLGIKIMENGKVIQSFSTANQLNNQTQQYQEQSMGIDLVEEKPKTFDKLQQKRTFYYATSMRNGQHRKSVSTGGYMITRSLKEDEHSLVNDKSSNYGNISKQTNSQSDRKNNSRIREIYPTKEIYPQKEIHPKKEPSKERYGIDSKYLIKEKLNFLINAQESINQQSASTYKKPLIKFKSISSIPYQTDKMQMNKVKKFSTITAKELQRSINNKSVNNSYSSSSSVNGINLNNGLAKSPLLLQNSNPKKQQSLQQNLSTTSYFSFMNKSTINPNQIRTNYKLNSSYLQKDLKQ